MDSGDEDELSIGARDFYKEREKLFKAGFVEGASKARDEAAVFFPPHDHPRINVYLTLGKLLGVIDAAITLSPGPEEEEELKSFFSRVQQHQQKLLPPDEITMTIDDTKTLVEDFKNLCQDASPLIETMFAETELQEQSGCGESCDCVQQVAKDLKKIDLSF